LLALVVGELPRHHIEQERRDSCIGEVGRDAAAHGAGTQNGCFADDRHVFTPPQMKENTWM